MNKSLRKSISFYEIEYILKIKNVLEPEKQIILAKLFEDIDSRPILLLKSEIKTVDDLERELAKILASKKELVSQIKDIFVVKHDLYLPKELKKLIVDNEKIAIFIGAGVSKLIGVPLRKMEIKKWILQAILLAKLLNFGLGRTMNLI